MTDRGGFEGLDSCVHCGFCLQACPTFLATGDESDSPRGRIELMRALEAGELAPADPGVALHLDRCLGCRGCEPVCPSGVSYGRALEAARALLTERRGVPPLVRAALGALTGAAGGGLPSEHSPARQGEERAPCTRWPDSRARREYPGAWQAGAGCGSPWGCWRRQRRRLVEDGGGWGRLVEVHHGAPSPNLPQPPQPPPSCFSAAASWTASSRTCTTPPSARSR